MHEMDGFEQLFTFKEIARLWRIGPGLVRKTFKDRIGVLNVASGLKRPAYRVPASLLLEVMLERGYTREQAEAIFRRGGAAHAA